MRFGLRLATAALAAFVGILTGTAISFGFVTAAHVLDRLLP